jgi:hypothetical protein
MVLLRMSPLVIARAASATTGWVNASAASTIAMATYEIFLRMMPPAVLVAASFAVTVS